MMRIAHRGLAGLYPENTLLSFEKCLEYSPDAIELDVQLTKDGELVVVHDEELLRTTGAKGWVKDFTLSELKELNAAYGYDFPKQEIPTLDEYFYLIKDRDILTFVELKNSFVTYPGLEEKVLEVIDERERRDSVIIYSANHYSVMKFKEMAPDIEICFPFDNWIFDYGEYCEKRGVTITIPYYKAMTPKLIADFHEHGVKVYPWTVDDRDEMLEMLKMGADGLLTNRIDILSTIEG